MSWSARAGAVVVVVGILGAGVAGPAFADTGTFGQQVRTRASMMLPDDLNSDGSITMTMPDGTSMNFGTFGAMATYMQSHQMCT